MSSPVLSSPTASAPPPPFGVIELSDSPEFTPSSREEQARLYALRTLGLLDTPPEPEFDDVVRLAATICGSPVGLISLVDTHRLWFKSVLGLTQSEVPREIAFCHHAIQQQGLMLIEDAALDQRFSDNPLVVEAGWRFYAGMPISSPGGHAVGTLCVLDRVPRSLTPDQRLGLEVLARQVNARLELRVKHQALEEALKTARLAQQDAEALEHRFHTFMNSGPFLAYMKDREGRLLYYNEPMASRFHVTRQDLLHKADLELWPSELAKTYRRNDQEVLQNGTLQILDEQTYDADGTVSIWRSYKFPCSDAAGQQLLGGISIEMTEQLQREEQLKHSQAELREANALLRELATVDPLTGLPNRRAFDEALRLTHRRARNANEPFSVLMLDVDHFKQHNDRFGHSHGDAVLKELARLMQGTFRAGDVVARYGGEEFVVLLPQANAAEALTLAQRVLTCVREHTWTKAPVTVSVGVSTSNGQVQAAQDVVIEADRALYTAKCAGRNQCALFRN